MGDKTPIAPARQAVLGNYDLLELCLAACRPETLLIAKMVSKTWRNLIRSSVMLEHASVLKPTKYPLQESSDEHVDYHNIYYDCESLKVHPLLHVHSKQGEVNGVVNSFVTHVPTRDLQLLHPRSVEYITRPPCQAIAVQMSLSFPSTDNESKWFGMYRDGGYVDGGCLIYNPMGVRIMDLRIVSAKILRQQLPLGEWDDPSYLLGYLSWSLRR
jgi:hypothetical protein